MQALVIQEPVVVLPRSFLELQLSLVHRSISPSVKVALLVQLAQQLLRPQDSHQESPLALSHMFLVAVRQAQLLLQVLVELQQVVLQVAAAEHRRLEKRVPIATSQVVQCCTAQVEPEPRLHRVVQAQQIPVMVVAREQAQVELEGQAWRSCVLQQQQ